MAITKHFNWSESMARSGYRGGMPPRVAMINGRPVRIRANVKKHARNLERLRTEVNKARKRHRLGPTGIRILSWVRSPAHNRAVGGARDSRHMYGDATDLSVQEIRRLCPWRGGAKDFVAIADKVFARGGLGTYPAGNRHVDSRGHRARWSAFRR